MKTIAQLTSAGKPFPRYEIMAENQALLDYELDRQRFTPPPPKAPALFRDNRTSCFFAKCPNMTTAFFCSSACEAAYLAMLDRWDTALTPTSPPTHYLHVAEDTAVVQLGNRALADAQQQADGDLVALACRGRRQHDHPDTGPRYARRPPPPLP